MATMNEKMITTRFWVSPRTPPRVIYRRPSSKRPASSIRTSTKNLMPRKMFKEVSEAYAVLSDEQKRARYDAMRSGNPFAGAPTASPYGGGYAGSAASRNAHCMGRLAFLVAPGASRVAAGCL